MSRLVSLGLTVTIALCASVLRSQDLSQPPRPPLAPASPRVVSPAPPLMPLPPEPPVDGVVEGVIDGVVGGVPGGIVGGVPGGAVLAPSDAMEPPELIGPFELIEPVEPIEPLEPLAPPEPIEPVIALMHPPEIGAMARQQAFLLQTPPQPPRPPRSDESDRFYERGQRSIEHSRWDEAVESFTEVVSRGGSRADGALYWKAYALNKLGRREEALAAIAELRKSYPSSRWLDDAKAFEVEVRQQSGKPVSPESAGDEELKLMALNGLMNSDPDRAVPLLEKLLHSSQSLKVKERALFVLTQSGSSHARQLVVDMAKGNSNPDLQMKAVNYLGVMGARKELGEVYGAANDVAVKRAVLNGLMIAGAKDQLFAAAKSEKNSELQRFAINQLGVLGARQELGEIYKVAADVAAKRAVLNSFMVAGAKDQLLTAAKSESNPELRHFAINQLGVLGAQGELWQLYQVETSPEIKRQFVNAFFVGGASDKLLEIARTAKEPELRRDAINRLGTMGAEHTGPALVSMYSNESDPHIRKAVINALFVQGNSHALVELARKETNVELKKEIVQRLSNMGSKEGTDYLMELLNK
jgi:tetratricopeptide (TPR) repeat protein